MAKGLLAGIKAIFEGDPGVRKVADDPLLSAELLLLFRMMLADGVVRESEMAVFRRICAEEFGIEGESLEQVVEYLNDIGYETTGTQAAALFAELDPERRAQLARHMAAIARADHHLVEQEVVLMKRMLDLLGLETSAIRAAG